MATSMVRKADNSAEAITEVASATHLQGQGKSYPDEGACVILLIQRLTVLALASKSQQQEMAEKYQPNTAQWQLRF